MAKCLTKFHKIANILKHAISMAQFFFVIFGLLVFTGFLIIINHHNLSIKILLLNAMYKNNTKVKSHFLIVDDAEMQK